MRHSIRDYACHHLMPWPAIELSKGVFLQDLVPFTLPLPYTGFHPQTSRRPFGYVKLEAALRADSVIFTPWHLEWKPRWGVVKAWLP